jgi:hypothetical protein
MKNKLFTKFNNSLFKLKFLNKRHISENVKLKSVSNKLHTVLCYFGSPSELALKKESNHIIACAVFRPYPIFKPNPENKTMPHFGYDYDKILPQLIKAQFTNVLLIDVFPNDLKFEVGVLELDTEYYKKKLSLDKNIKFTRINTTYSGYFHNKTIESFRKLSLGLDIFYQFHGTNWPLLLSEFKLLNYTISGGSSTKRHMLSPIADKLSQFLGCTVENRQVTVGNSFHLDRDSSSKTTHTLIDFKSKDPNISFMLDYENRRRVAICEGKKRISNCRNFYSVT